MSEIKGVIFDWGGVLIDNPAPGVMKYFADKLGVSIDALKVAYDEITPEYQKGGMREAEYWKRMSDSLGVHFSEKNLWGKAFAANYRPREEVFNLVYSLKANGYKMGLLSNTEYPQPNRFSEVRYNVFDKIFASCDEGYAKPDEMAYLKTLDRLRIAPEESVFIDDNEAYVNASIDIGINGILYKGIDDLKNRLRRLAVRF